MDEWLPLISKDLDLFGTIELLHGMKDRFGGEYRLSGPRRLTQPRCDFASTDPNGMRQSCVTAVRKISFPKRLAHFHNLLPFLKKRLPPQTSPC